MVRAVSARAKASLRRERPRRGDPAATRARLVAAAADLFNRDGYAGTDSNRIARRAGYAAGTFYKHFADKREILLAAYEAWVSGEWREIRSELSTAPPPAGVAGRILELVLDHHLRWRGLRAALQQLLREDAEARRFHRDQRARQIEMLQELRRQAGAPPRQCAEDAVLLLTMERVCDAIASGELRDLGVEREPVLRILRRRLREALALPAPGKATSRAPSASGSRAGP